MQIEDS